MSIAAEQNTSSGVENSPSVDLMKQVFKELRNGSTAAITLTGHDNDVNGPALRCSSSMSNVADESSDWEVFRLASQRRSRLALHRQPLTGRKRVRQVVLT